MGPLEPQNRVAIARQLGSAPASGSQTPVLAFFLFLTTLSKNIYFPSRNRMGFNGSALVWRPYE